MLTPKLKKIKKYLFLISVMIFVVSLGHLTYLYFYDNATTIPIKGGNVSEGLIGNFPSLNPLRSLDGNNQYVIGLLYRSLLKYDLEQGKIVGDIASCDISSLTNIECYINEGVKWSNGLDIVAEDAYETYRLIRDYNTNPIITQALEGTTIEYIDNRIVFKNNKEDINFLNVFFQPILSKETINTLSEENIFGNFPSSDGIYSGNFVISSVTSDTTIGVSKINLEKNTFNNAGNLASVSLSIFPDTNSFLKNRQSVSIFNDNDNIIGNSLPRLASNRYTLPQYVSLFINSDNVTNSDLRNYILYQVNQTNLVELLGKENFEVVHNPYLSDISMTTEPSSRNFESIMSSLGYAKKSKYIENSTLDETKDDVTIDIDDTDEISINLFQETSSYVTNPNYKDKYNFITRDNILLEGNVDEGVDAVYINDYRLTGFSSGDRVFYYRLGTNYDSIEEGLNSYKIYFEKAGEKEFKEEIFFMYYRNQNTLDDEREKLVNSLYEDYKAKNEIVINSEGRNTDNIDNEALSKFDSLDENTYYNENLSPFILKLYYYNTDKNIDLAANYIKNSLKELGIEVELIPFSKNDLERIILNKGDYDMMLTGINLGYFEFNIFPYFHSSQAKGGLNFSSVKRTSLDLLLEELKSNILHVDRVDELEGKILEILKEEQIVKTLYTPKINLLVDKNIKIEKVYEKLPSKHLRAYVLDSSYMKDERVINWENKSITGFFSFLFTKIYE